MPDPWLIVAVCTNRGAKALEPTLGALAPQLAASEAAAGLVVANGVSESSFSGLSRLAEGRGFEAERLGEAGVAEARNHAAERAGAEKIVAFVDDDVVVGLEWLERLLGHWREAPPEVACIGGPIRPRFLADPPPWMSRRLDVVYALLDRGPGVKPLKPGVEDAWCANASFRAGPLLEAGGFDAAFGARGDRLPLGEDTEVQLRLAAHGYRGLYAGDLQVEHLIGAERMSLREVFRRRYYNGAYMRTTGQWRPLDGAARLLAGAAQAGLAVALRRPAVMAEGVARIGSGAGVLSASLRGRRRPGTAG